MSNKINQHVLDALNSASQKDQIKILNQNIESFKYIKNPSEEIQLLAIKKDYNFLKYIDNPSKKIRLESLKQSYFSIEYIKNPTQEEQLIAVKKCGDMIRYIKNPSEEVQLASVAQTELQQLKSAIYYQMFGSAIQYIENPSEKVQLEAVKNRMYAFDHIKNPTEKVKSLYKTLWGFKVIKRMMCGVMSESLQMSSYMLEILNELSEKNQIKLVEKHPAVIKLIKNPSKKVESISEKFAKNHSCEICEFNKIVKNIESKEALNL